MDKMWKDPRYIRKEYRKETHEVKLPETASPAPMTEYKAPETRVGALSEEIKELINEHPDQVAKDRLWEKYWNIHSHAHTDYKVVRDESGHVIEGAVRDKSGKVIEGKERVWNSEEYLEKLKDLKNEIAPTMSEVKDFDELKKALSGLEYVVKADGVEQRISGQELIGIIDDIRSGKSDFSALPKDEAGLYDKVKELMAKPDKNDFISDKRVEAVKEIIDNENNKTKILTTENWKIQLTGHPDVIRLNRGDGWIIVNRQEKATLETEAVAEFKRDTKKKAVEKEVDKWHKAENHKNKYLQRTGANVDQERVKTLTERKDAIQTAWETKYITDINTLAEAEENLAILSETTGSPYYKDLLLFARGDKKKTKIILEGLKKDKEYGLESSPLTIKIFDLLEADLEADKEKKRQTKQVKEADLDTRVAEWHRATMRISDLDPDSDRDEEELIETLQADWERKYITDAETMSELKENLILLSKKTGLDDYKDDLPLINISEAQKKDEFEAVKLDQASGATISVAKLKIMSLWPGFEAEKNSLGLNKNVLLSGGRLRYVFRLKDEETENMVDAPNAVETASPVIEPVLIGPRTVDRVVESQPKPKLVDDAYQKQMKNIKRIESRKELIEKVTKPINDLQNKIGAILQTSLKKITKPIESLGAKVDTLRKKIVDQFNNLGADIENAGIRDKLQEQALDLSIKFWRHWGDDALRANWEKKYILEAESLKQVRENLKMLRDKTGLPDYDELIAFAEGNKQYDNEKVKELNKLLLNNSIIPPLIDKIARLKKFYK